MIGESLLEQSFNHFQRAFIECYDESKGKEIQRLTEENKRKDVSIFFKTELPLFYRLSAMKAALETMSGISVKAVLMNEDDEMTIQLQVKECDAKFTINREKRVDSLEILSPGFEWINTSQILSDAQQFPAPNDLRTAVFYLSSAQNAKELFAKDCAKLKRFCLVTIINPFVIKFTVKNGLSFLVEGCQYYDKVLNAVKVIEVTFPSLDQNWNEDEIKYELNNGCFTNLLDMYQHIMSHYD